jgi:dienelactone hydrolase
MGRRGSILDSITTRVGARIDEALLGALSMRFQRRRRDSDEARTHEAARHGDRRAALEELIAFYRPLQLEDAFFPSPPSPRLVAEQRRGALPGGGRIVDVKWESRYVPTWDKARADYLSFDANRWVFARLYEQPAAAPSVLCIHGYTGGNFFVEERAFVARWIYGLGVNVAMIALPFHGARAVDLDGKTRAASWPSTNPARTNEGFGQAIWDARSVLRLLVARGARPEAAAIGMSLGGYTASLLATVEELVGLCAYIPVASFADLMWDHGESSPERARAERDGITRDLLKEAYRVHTPIARAPRLPSERVVIASSAGDRIAPPEHAEWLAAHFGCRELRLPGGHLLQVGRGEAFRAFARVLASQGLLRNRD